jgi:hypothetical protein
MTKTFLDLRNELQRAAARRIARRRRRLFAATAVLVLAVGGAGATVAATGWGLGDPAPRAVVHDFAEYPSEVGLEPIPRGAFLAARDGEDFALYATRNRQGGYCLTVSAPWGSPAKLPGGATCMTHEDAREPVAVGIVAVGRFDGAERTAPHMVAGRVRDPRAHVVRFTTMDGEPIERPIGADGFFLAALDVPFCEPNEVWKPTFVALDADGRELARVRITLMAADRLGGCGAEVSPHGPYASDRQ